MQNDIIIRVKQTPPPENMADSATTRQNIFTMTPFSPFLFSNF
jgi:hypothetical protein